jgi:hypothetical protein
MEALIHHRRLKHVIRGVLPTFLGVVKFYFKDKLSLEGST